MRKRGKMAKKCFYAVRIGRNPGIYTSWKECNEQVYKFPGSEYKGFTGLHQAKLYMSKATKQVGSKPNQKPKTDKEINNVTKVYTPSVIIYTDGSFDEKLKVYGYGLVVIENNGEVLKFFGAGNRPDSLRSRNVTGELIAAMLAVQYAIKNGHKAMELRYDYIGVERWAKGDWKTKTDLTRKYAEAMRNWSDKIDIKFTKVDAHTGNKYNELADILANYAVKNFYDKKFTESIGNLCLK